MHRHLLLFLILAAAAQETHAAWTVVTYADEEAGTETRVARIENGDGYSLEIYRDANDVIRTRFNMNPLVRLGEGTCPTFQVDDRKAGNRSINDAPCIMQGQWAEYVLGYITDDKVTSTDMHNLMNGNNITYRFILQESGYDETKFSLAGSKRILQEVLGKNLVVSTEQNQP
jgi:hypothetical protein